MNRRDFLKAAAAGAAAVWMPRGLGAQQDEGTPPNLVFIMADDMGYGDLGCYGATKIPTPHIDALATEGVRFTDAHSPSAVCTPTRYGVLTGRYCWRSRLKSGVLDGYAPRLIEPGRMTVASMLKAQGYATACVGKWHLGLGWVRKEGEPEKPDTAGLEKAARQRAESLARARQIDYSKPVTDGPGAVGFDYSFIIPASLDFPPYCFLENGCAVGIPSVEKAPYHPQQRGGLMVPGWRDDQVGPTFTQKATGWIEQHVKANPGRPFFLYLVPSAPHRPCVPPDFVKGKSQAGPRGDMVVEVDWTVGEVCKTLDRLGLAGRTLVVVASDNGARPADVDGNTYGHKSCGDWRGFKADIWDGGHRIPCLARWPGQINPGTVCGELICLTDFMATCAAIVGAPLPEAAAEDSFNLMPLFEGAGQPVREAVVHHSVGGMFCVRQGPWKMILGLGSGGFSAPRREQPQPGGPQGQLYDMQADPAETENLWLKHPEVVERLTALLEKWKQDGRSRPV